MLGPKAAIAVLPSADAQKSARMYGTPLYLWENGKVVSKKQ
jgi:hypothetical protein